MKSYGQFCPVAKAAELFCERWTALVLREIWTGSTRFSDIQRGVPLMSPTLLSTRLRQLEAEGIVTRQRDGKSWNYLLTEAGSDFVPLIDGLGRWGMRWSRRELAAKEIDLGLLLWGIEKNARADCFGEARTTIRFDFTDQPAGKRLWWFVNENGKCQMCVQDPGFEVDLFVAGSLRDVIHVIRGDLTMAGAIDTGRMEVTGPTRLRRKLADWLDINPWGHVKPARRELMAAE
jgi:DNA-binding HxlR family transcriptional regulator